MSSSSDKGHGINRKAAKSAKRKPFLCDLDAFAVNKFLVAGHRALATIRVDARE
jgi:hypothetical protein